MLSLEECFNEDMENIYITTEKEFACVFNDEQR